MAELLDRDLDAVGATIECCDPTVSQWLATPEKCVCLLKRFGDGTYQLNRTLAPFRVDHTTDQKPDRVERRILNPSRRQNFRMRSSRNWAVNAKLPVSQETLNAACTRRESRTITSVSRTHHRTRNPAVPL